jgi:hypothetical protein
MDFYTKAVLTVIAAALSVIAWQNLATAPARADAMPPLTRVAICDPGNSTRCVGITDKGWLDVMVHQAN